MSCCRSSLQNIAPERSPLHHHNQEDRLNRVATRHFVAGVLRCLLLVFVAIRLFGQTGQSTELKSPGTSAGSSDTEAIATRSSPYVISAAQLRIPGKAVRHLELAEKRFRKMDLPGATAEINRALEIDPRCAPAFSMRSFVKLAANDFLAAVEDAARAVAIDPYDAHSYLALATAYNDRSEFSKASEAAQQALKINPDLWQGQLEMAKSLYGRGEYHSASRMLDQIGRDFPDVHLARANLLIKMGRPLEAVEQFNLFLKQAPNDARCPRIAQIVVELKRQTANSTISTNNCKPRP